jgi:hypothetical protein
MLKVNQNVFEEQLHKCQIIIGGGFPILLVTLQDFCNSHLLKGLSIDPDIVCSPED